MHRLDSMDARNNSSGRKGMSGEQRIPHRQGRMDDSDGEEEEVQMGGVRRREPRQPRDPDARRDPLDELTKRMKVEVSDFLGKLNLDAFHDWITALEDYFDWFSVPEERKVHFVKLKLKGPARAWWSIVEEQLQRTYQAPIIEWGEMKERLESKGAHQLQTTHI